MASRTRSKVGSIPSAGTAPERILVREVRARGARPRLNDAAYPGTPDLCFPRARVAVFVDGCFWHGCPVHYRAPRTRAVFWRAKLERVKAHDARVRGELEREGWMVFSLWECEVRRRPAACGRRIVDAWRWRVANRRA